LVLALVVSGSGRIARMDDELVDYRLHGRNVVGPMAREAFEARRLISLELIARNALAEPAAAFFVDRKLGAARRMWNGVSRRYAIRCMIGMLHAGPRSNRQGRQSL
jgi:hypothetical protein